MVRPHVAVVTAIAPVHLENLGSLEAIADEKAEIYSGLAPEGVAIITGDAPHVERLHRRSRSLAGGAAADVRRGAGRDMRLVSVNADAGGSDVEVAFEGRTYRYRIGAPGAHIGDELA